MRWFLLLFSVSLFYTACKSSAKTENEAEVSALKNSPQTEIATITFEATTRGFQEHITVEPNAISKRTSQSKEEIRHTISAEEWQNLLDLVANLNLKELSKIEAPTSRRYADADLAATISINTIDKTYTSSQFDKGTPPKELEPLVNVIQSYFTK